MKKVVRTKTIEYEVFISDDGVEFDNLQDALLHDRFVRGEIIVCPRCKGQKFRQYYRWLDDGNKSIIDSLCDCCYGKGYILNN